MLVQQFACHISLAMCLVWRAALILYVIGQVQAHPVYGYEDPSKNLVSNWDFEEDYGADDWTGYRCTIGFSNDSRTGNRSAYVYDRLEGDSQSGIRQSVRNLTMNTMYYFSTFIKILNQDPYTPRRLRLVRKLQYSDDGSHDFQDIANIDNSLEGDMWLHLGGDFITPDREFDHIQFYIGSLDPEVDYLMDTSSLIVLESDENWTAKANDRIQQHRKNFITLTGTVPLEYPDLALVNIQVNQISHDFAFGTAFKPTHLTGTGSYNDKYRGFLYDHFEWAVFETGMKWRSMEPEKGQIDFATVDQSLDELEANGMKTRGHSLLWNAEKNQPDWVKPLTGEDMAAEVNKRVNYMVSSYNDRISQWDVINEHLADRFYENATGNYDLLLDVFDNVTSLDPDSKLLINEFGVVITTGYYTSDNANLARYLLENGANLYAMGIQSHHWNTSVPIEFIQKRLDIQTAVGLPIWITEVKVHTYNVTERAQYLEDILRLYFSTQLVEGVLLWGFSSVNNHYDDCALTEGEEVVPNEAGLTWIRLFKEEWTTNEVAVPESRDFSIVVSGFHGDYNLTVLYDDIFLSSDQFTLPKGQNVTIPVTLIECTSKQ